MRPRRSRRVCVAQVPDNAPPCDFRYAQTAHFARFFLGGLIASRSVHLVYALNESLLNCRISVKLIVHGI